MRCVDQLEGGAPLAGRHPLGDDRPRAVRQGTEEYPFARERGHALAVYGECLTVLRMPRIVDGDRE